MTKDFQQIKNMIEDWIKIANAKFIDITEEERQKQPKLKWIFKINEILVVYMLEGRPDRVSMESPVHFGKEHQKETSTMGDREFLQFTVDIFEPLVIAGITPKVLQNKKEIKLISLQSYIDTESLEREKFFRMWDQLSAFRQLIIKKVQAKLGVSGMDNSKDVTSSDSPIYG